MTKILFVCYGNICRSPMSELLFNDLVEKRGMANRFFAESAATSDEEIGNGVYHRVRAILEAEGIDCSKKRARRLSFSDYEAYDLIIGMDKANYNDMRGLFCGDKDKKLFKLLDFCGEEKDVLDPWYTRQFDYCKAEIERGLDGLLKYLLSKDN